MTNNRRSIIDEFYQESVKGLNGQILRDKDKWYEYILGLPLSLQVTYTISVLDRQVLNGGFDQYFVNGYGQFAYITIDFLKMIKAFKTADMLEQALKKINYRNLTPDIFRKEAVYADSDNVIEFLNGLDKEYYDLFKHPSTEDIHKLLTDFLTQYVK